MEKAEPKKFIKRSLSVKIREGFFSFFVILGAIIILNFYALKSDAQVKNSHTTAKAESGKLDFYVTNPWIYLISSFIGGVEVNVVSFQVWNTNGDLTRADNGKILRELASNAKIIALDENDAQNFGLFPAKNKFENIRVLYSKFPIDVNNIPDPSIMPFIAQKILVILSEWDPQNYLYYQRRLAEFQARLSSSILAGQVLRGISICSLSTASGILLQAAGCKVERPEPEALERWQKGKFNGLREYLDEKKLRNVIIVVDDDTPRNLKKYLLARSDVFHWNRPQLEKSDYPTFLHEQYISLWQRIIKKPLPSNRK